MKNIEFVKGPCVGEVRRLNDETARRLVSSGFAAFRSKKMSVTHIARPIVGRGKSPRALIHPSNPNYGASKRGKGSEN